jgi:hypothetical protein
MVGDRTDALNVIAATGKECGDRSLRSVQCDWERNEMLC